MNDVAKLNIVVNQSSSAEKSTNQTLDLASVLKSCADVLRLQVLRVLSDTAYSVQELCHIFDLRQPNISHHLKQLMEQGLLTARKEGNCVYYSRAINLPVIAAQVIKELLLELDKQPLAIDIAQRVDEIEQQRDTACEAFFSKHIDDFQKNQERIVSYEYYNPSVWEVLQSVNLPQTATVVEVGSGEGAFLEVLASGFDKVYAVDISADMLARAESRIVAANVENVSFVRGEVKALPETMKVDAIVMNMVLHHVSSPQQLFKQAADKLADNGVMVICDLVSHDQNWVKEYCGDLWLGFSQEQLTHWAQANGLSVEKFIFTGLRNGFQIIVGLFRK